MKSNKTEVLSFYGWLNEQNQPASNFLRRETYEAGQQSKQAEVEELQKRIDRAVEHIEDYYGVVELSMIVDILKGDQS